MTDRITEIQDCLDQLLTQAYATLNYITTQHQPAPIPGQPFQPPNGVLPGQAQSHSQAQEPPSQTPNTTAPPTPRTQNAELPELDVPPAPVKPSTEQFQATLQELAQDMVRKEREIEGLAMSLPGLKRGRVEQEEEVRRLEREMQQVRAVWEEKARVKEGLVERVEGVFMGVRRV